MAWLNQKSTSSTLIWNDIVRHLHPVPFQLRNVGKNMSNVSTITDIICVQCFIPVMGQSLEPMFQTTIWRDLLRNLNSFFNFLINYNQRWVKQINNKLLRVWMKSEFNVPWNSVFIEPRPRQTASFNDDRDMLQIKIGLTDNFVFNSFQSLWAVPSFLEIFSKLICLSFNDNRLRISRENDNHFVWNDSEVRSLAHVFVCYRFNWVELICLCAQVLDPTFSCVGFCQFNVSPSTSSRNAADLDELLWTWTGASHRRILFDF